jgi:rod shape-determining protein MreD
MVQAGRKRGGILKGHRRSYIPAVQESPLYMIKVFFLLLVAVVVQTTIAPYINVLGARPEVALIVVVAIAMYRGPMWGAGVGFFVGLLVDIALVQTMGISSFLYTLAGYFSGRYTAGADPDSWVPPLLAVFIVTTVVQLLNALVMFLLGVEASISFILFRIVAPSALINALLAAPVFVVCRWWMGGEKQRAFSVEP